MLTSNHAPMLGSTRNGGTRRYQPQGVRTTTVVGRYVEQRRAIRSDEKAEHAWEVMAALELDHGAEVILGLAHDLDDAEAIARAEAMYDMLHDDADAMLWDGWSTPDEWIADRIDDADLFLLTEQDIEDILTGDDLVMPGAPTWGETRVDYTEFATGFIVR